VLAPAKTPREMIMRLNEGIAKALGDAELRSALMATGVLPSASSPEEVTRLMQSERARWAKLITDHKITVD
jgi:tripartite-type tricarboxylate transporter receptor subunit TctC